MFVYIHSSYMESKYNEYFRVFVVAHTLLTSMPKKERQKRVQRLLN
jgi:hypothetical protein